MSESIHKSERKPQAMHNCCVCLRDITGMRRVKDPKGRYFCKRCYKVGQLRKYQLAKRRLAASPIISAASDLRLTVASLDPALLTMQIPSPALPIPPVVAPSEVLANAAAATAPSSVPEEPVIAAESAATASIPSAPATSEPFSSARCPLCNEPLPPNQRVCNDCAAELPSLNNLLSLREEHSQRADRQQRRLKNLKTAALIAIPLGIASLALIAYGHWHSARPAFEAAFELPTSRTEAVQEILACIQDGSDTSRENALCLVAAHTSQPADPVRDDAYRSAFKLMHDDFSRKYGPNWLAEARIQNLFPEDDTQFVPFAVTIRNDVYHITSQAITSASAAPDRASSPHIHFPENGKQRFAVFQIEEYAVVHDSSVERRDPLKVTDSPAPADFKGQANSLPSDAPNSQ